MTQLTSSTRPLYLSAIPCPGYTCRLQWGHGIQRRVQPASYPSSVSVKSLYDDHRLAGSANPNFILFIAPQGEMASFSIGTTPFFLEIDSAQGSSVQEIPRTPDESKAVDP